MYRFSFTESVAGKAQEVSRQLFYEIISRKDIKEKCKLIAEGKIELKRKLPAFCWHAWFDEGKRKNSCAHPSGLIMIDVDHVDNPRELYASIEQKAKENGLLVAHVTPSTKGLRLVFPLPQGMDIVKAQNYYADILNDKLTTINSLTIYIENSFASYFVCSKDFRVEIVYIFHFLFAFKQGIKETNE